MTDVAAGARSSKGRTRFTPRAALLVLVLVALLVYLAVPVKAYLAERSHVGQLQQQTQVLQRQNVALRQQVRQLHDPAYVEKLARCEGMVRPGEISFVVVPKGGGGGSSPDAC